MSKHDQTSGHEALREGESQAPQHAATSQEIRKPGEVGPLVSGEHIAQAQGARPRTPPEGRPGARQESLPRMPGTSPRGDGGAQRMMTDAMVATEHVGSGFIGGVAHVATDLVHGVGDVGNEVVSVVRDTASTAISGVGVVGDTAVRTLTGLLVGLMGGVRQIGAAAAGHGPNGAQGRMMEREGAETSPPPQQQRQREREEMYH